MFDDLKRAARDRLAWPGRPSHAADAPVEPRSDNSTPPTSGGLKKTARTGNDSVLIQALKRATTDGLRHTGEGYAAPESQANPEAGVIAEAERKATRDARRRTDEAHRAMEAEAARSRLDAEHVAIQLAAERIAAETRLAEQAQTRAAAAHAAREQSQARARLEREALHAAQLRMEAEATLLSEEKARAAADNQAQEAAQARIDIETEAERAAQATTAAHEQAIKAARVRERAEEKARKAALARAQADAGAEQKAHELAEHQAVLRALSVARTLAEQAVVEQAKRRVLAEQRATDEADALHQAEKREAAQRATVRASGSRARVQLSWPLAAAGATLALILGIAIGTSERALPPATTPASRADRDSTTPVMPEKLRLRLDDDFDRFGRRPKKITGVESRSGFWRQAAAQPLGPVNHNIGDHSMAYAEEPSAQPDSFFKALSRPDKPNNWLIAPRDFPLAADGLSPVFNVPVQILIDAFRSAALANGRAKVVESSEHAMHIVDTTPIMGYKDDVHIQFIPVSERQSTLSAYSASRTGYWDIGTNRRRLEKWLRETQSRLSAKR